MIDKGDIGTCLAMIVLAPHMTSVAAGIMAIIFIVVGHIADRMERKAK